MAETTGLVLPPENSRTILITGITGFSGSHLADFLLRNFPGQLQIHGVSHASTRPEQSTLAESSEIILHTLDLYDTPMLAVLLREIRPALIFHLAAQSHVSQSLSTPRQTIETNVNLTLSLLEAVCKAGLAGKTRILNTGSSDQYGFLNPEDLPVKETAPFRPGNPYAVSKIAQEMLGYQYYRSNGLHVINTRSFNQVGPRQSPKLALGAFAQQIALAEAGRISPVIKVGNLDAQRDYTDARDIVRACWLALAHNIPGYPGCQPGEAYNLCSGESHSIHEVLQKLLRLARKPLEIETDPDRMRPSDVPVLLGDPTKFHQATGWTPQIPLERSLSDLLDYWRKEILKTPVS